MGKSGIEGESGPRISLCMIVRNEEAKLGRCLASVEGVVDERVVVDTGSSDGTREVARAAGARVLEFAWCDDFAAARNHSLEAARGDWILVLDADEVLQKGGARERLLAFADMPNPAAGQVELENVTTRGERSLILLSRFFRRDPEVRYHRRIHEQLLRAGQPLPGRPTGVRVRHDGYVAEAVAGRDKLTRNEALLRAQLAEHADGHPDSGYDWYQLGRTLEVAMRFPEALEAYERSVELARDEDPHLPHLFESAATCLRQMGRSAQALEWLSQVEDAFHARPDTVFLIALLAMDVGQLERAQRGFLRCLEMDRHPRRWSGAESSLQATTVAPAHNLGVLYECTDRPRDARLAYERALSFDSNHAGARAGLQRLGVRAAGE